MQKHVYDKFKILQIIAISQRIKEATNIIPMICVHFYSTCVAINSEMLSNFIKNFKSDTKQL